MKRWFPGAALTAGLIVVAPAASAQETDARRADSLPVTLPPRAFIGSAFLNPDIVGGAPVAFEPGMPRHVLVGLTFSRLDR